MCAFHHSPQIVTDGLSFIIDAQNPKSYIGSGTSVNDLSGNSYGGTLSTAAIGTDTPGIFTFDGTSRVLPLPYSGLLDLGTDFSIDVGFKHPDYDNGSGIFYGQDALSPTYTMGYGVYVRTVDQYGLKNNSLGLSLGVNYWKGNVWSSETDDIIVNQGNHGIITVADTDTSSKTVKFYINGVLSTTYYGTAATEEITKWATDTGCCNVARYYTPTTPSYGNTYSDVRVPTVKIYKNKILTATECLQNYNALKGRFGL